MKILVTGSSGFIGRWIWRALTGQGHDVIGLDKAEPPAEFRGKQAYRCDILDQNRLRLALKESRPEAVIHLAARIDLNEKHDLRGYAPNIDGVKNLVEAIDESPSVRRVIYTSSQLVCRVGYVPSSNDDYCPNTLYGQSKVLTEQIVKSGNNGGVEWCLVRPTTVWGPGMSAHYQRMLDLIMRGLFFHCGRSRLLKSYSYAGNIAHQYSRLLAVPPEAINRKTFYLADYSPISLRDYLNDFARELGARSIPTIPVSAAWILAFFGDLLGRGGMNFPFNSLRLRNILAEYVFDLNPTEKVCGPLPFSYGEGIRQTAVWYRAERRKF